MATINPFAGMSPPTVDTFAALVRIRYRQTLRLAIEQARDGKLDEWSLGVANGMVFVLYDLLASDAYSKLHGLERVRAIARARSIPSYEPVGKNRGRSGCSIRRTPEGFAVRFGRGRVEHHADCLNALDALMGHHGYKRAGQE